MSSISLIGPSSWLIIERNQGCFQIFIKLFNWTMIWLAVWLTPRDYNLFIIGQLRGRLLAVTILFPAASVPHKPVGIWLKPSYKNIFPLLCPLGARICGQATLKMYLDIVVCPTTNLPPSDAVSGNRSPFPQASAPRMATSNQHQLGLLTCRVFQTGGSQRTPGRKHITVRIDHSCLLLMQLSSLNVQSQLMRL